MEAETSEGAESYHTDEEEFARFASESSDTDSSVPKVAEIVGLEADPDPVARLDEAEAESSPSKESHLLSLQREGKQRGQGLLMGRALRLLAVHSR